MMSSTSRLCHFFALYMETFIDLRYTGYPTSYVNFLGMKDFFKFGKIRIFSYRIARFIASQNLIVTKAVYNKKKYHHKHVTLPSHVC